MRPEDGDVPLSDTHPDWHQPLLPEYADWESRGGLTVEVANPDGDIVVSWWERRDDHWGRTRRQSEPIPRAVLLAVLGVPNAH